MSQPNGNGYHPTEASVTITVNNDPPVVFSSIEDAALALLELAHPIFLGRLKTVILGHIQRQAIGIEGTGEIGKHAIQHV